MTSRALTANPALALLVCKTLVSPADFALPPFCAGVVVDDASGAMSISGESVYLSSLSLLSLLNVGRTGRKCLGPKVGGSSGMLDVGCRRARDAFISRAEIEGRTHK